MFHKLLHKLHKVLPGLGKRHLPSTLEAFFKERSRELKDGLLYFEVHYSIICFSCIVCSSQTVFHFQAVLHVVTLEQTGLLTQEAAENALQSLRRSLQTLQEHEEIHKQMTKDELVQSDPLVRIDGRDDITENKIKGGTISNW